MKRNEFAKIVSERILILDGATGTELHKRGSLEGVRTAEELNIKAPEKIQAIYRDYLESGANVILANTFGGNRMKLADYGLEDRLAEINQAGVTLAKDLAKTYKAYVAADIAPLGAYLQPLGRVTFDRAYEIFAEQAKALAAAKPDLMVVETMAEIRELKAAFLAARDNFDGPVLVQMTFTSDGTTVTGTDLLTFLAVAESMGADGVGMNCSVGPGELAKLAATLAANTSLPISFKPNAGMPRLINRQTVFPGTVEEFIAAAGTAYAAGVNMFGGCCGTTPEFIEALARHLKGKKPVARPWQDKILVSSRTRAVNLAGHKDLIIIGERINPTNRRKFQEELLAGNFATLRREAQEQVRSGAHILDLNLGLPNANEKALMTRAVDEIQETVNVPLCLDSSSPETLEAGIRACAGKPIINSVNGDDDRMDRILPLVKRYGAAVIGLTVDDRGIPRTAEERLQIAEKIITRAEETGIPRSGVIIDYLTLSASAMADRVVETLEAVSESKRRWPEVKTVLGISNISFGLPHRQILNSTFLKMAREAGLDMAIMNPHEDWSIDDVHARRLLSGKDAEGENYIAMHGVTPAPKPASATVGEKSPEDRLFDAVVEGNRDEIAFITREVLAAGKAPLDIANNILLKGLNEVGERFNRKEYFLPQVIRASEATQEAFAKLKPLLAKDRAYSAGKIILATVKGDVHDIGKNIVGAVMESHGWEVVDLGKNADVETIMNAAREEKAQVVGLSALMTTTMPEMEKVVKARDAEKAAFKVIIGGAPVTERFAGEIGADGYAKDAVEAPRIARQLLNN